MLQKAYIRKLKKHMLAYAEQRRDVIKQAGDALHASKRAIFAMHRDDLKEAKEKLKTAESLLKKLQKKYAKDPRVLSEGSMREGLEEYVEATLLFQFMNTGKIGQITNIDITETVYIAGLCDVPGELQRYAVKAATERDVKTVQKCQKAAEEILGELIEFNLTKYLRTKFDQAKQVVRRIEQIVYELSLRS